MADLWHYTCEGKPMEPLPTEALRRLAVQGVLKPTDLVWREGMAQWVRADSERALFPGGPTAADLEPIPVLPVSPITVAPVAAVPRTTSEGSRDEPRRRRPTAKAGTGLGVGCIVALCVGGGLGVVLCVVVALLAIGTAPVQMQQGPQKRGMPGMVQAWPDMPPPIGEGPPPPIPPGDPKKQKLPIVYTVALDAHREDLREFVFEKGYPYEFTLITDERQVDVDLYVQVGDFVFARDIWDDPDANISWTPEATGRYTVKIINLGDHRQRGRNFARSTLTIGRGKRIELPGEAVPTVDPPPPGVEALPGAHNLPLLAPGRDHSFKIQVSKEQSAEIRLRTFNAMPTTDVNLFVVRQRDNKEIASDTTVGSTGVATIPAEATTEIYRLEVRNVGPLPALCSVLFRAVQP